MDARTRKYNSSADPDVNLEPESEDEHSVEILQELELTERAIKPLFEDSWT